MSKIGRIFGGGSSSNDDVVNEQRRQAEEARQREEERQRRINEGLAAINQTFGAAGGTFTPEYYNRYRNAITGYQLPQLEQQYTDARDRLTYDLSRAGQLRSSVAAEELARLSEQYDLNRANILSSADQAVGSLRDRVNAARTDLTNQLYASEDPSSVNQAALRSAAALGSVTPPADPLGELFRQATIGYSNVRQGEQYRNAVASIPTTNPYRSSGRVVRS